MSEDAFVEKIAALSHDQWTGWFIWMHEKWDQTHASGEAFRDRWRRQAATPYADLSEAEKESDRIEARKVIALADAEVRALRAEAARLRAALRKAADMLDLVLDHHCGASHTEVSDDFWFDWVLGERDAARAALAPEPREKKEGTS